MITFKNQCSLKGMSKLKDQSVDLIVTDPPYNIADNKRMTKQGNKFVTTQKAWGKDFQDNWKSPEDFYNWLKPFVEQMVRVLKEDGSIVMFFDRKYAGYYSYLIEKEFGLISRNNLYFVKSNPLPSCRKNNYRSTVEEAVWFTKSKNYNLNFINQTEMKQVFTGAIGKSKTKKIHPCQKYNWMIEPLIERHSKAGDVVLDPFAGSGSTLRIAAAMGRKAIGFEKSTAFYKEAYSELFGVVSEAKRPAANDPYAIEMEFINFRIREITKNIQSLERNLNKELVAS